MKATWNNDTIEIWYDRVVYMRPSSDLFTEEMIHEISKPGVVYTTPLVSINLSIEEDFNV